MKKSDDKEEEPDMPELPQVDYSKIPPEVEEAIAQKPYTKERKGKLSWDGKQFTVRIPMEIANEMQITKENYILFRMTKPVPGSEEKPDLEIKLVQEP